MLPVKWIRLHNDDHVLIVHQRDLLAAVPPGEVEWVTSPETANHQ